MPLILIPLWHQYENPTISINSLLWGLALLARLQKIGWKESERKQLSFCTLHLPTQKKLTGSRQERALRPGRMQPSAHPGCQCTEILQHTSSSSNVFSSASNKANNNKHSMHIKA